MSRIKKQILTKIKEYASKMGTNTMGGDDYTSKKKGGLRDFDGYDNVDYNKDMPMDEGKIPQPIQNLIGDMVKNKIQSRTVTIKTPTAFKRFMKDVKPAIKDKLLSVRANPINKDEVTISLGPKATRKMFEDMPMDEATKGDIMRAVKGKPNPYTLVVIKRGKVIYQKDIKNPQDAPAIYSVIRKHMDKGERIHIEDRTGKVVFKEGINEACWKGYKEVGGKIKNGKQVPNCVPESIDEGMMSTIDQIRKDSKSVRDFIKNVLSDRDFRDMKTDKNFVKYLKSIYEGIEENFPSNWMQGRTSDYHTQLRGKKKDYSGGTNFKNKNHGQPDLEEVHKVAGRPVKINKGKKKDGTDWTVTFKNGKTVPLSDVLALIKPFPKGIKESGKEKSEKNYKDWKSTNEGFDKIEHLKLLNKAMRAMPGSPKQKDIIKKLNVVRKAGGMKPLKERTKPDFNSKGYKEASKLVAKLRSTTFKKMNDDELEQFRAALAFSFDLKEYASKLTLSYILDKDSKLDGTPEDIKAIDEKAERDYKDEYKKFQSSKKSKKYRAELNKYNRQKGTYGNGDGKDASHKGGKIVGFESASKNRGRKEKSRLKKK
jgi:hypothetical protein